MQVHKSYKIQYMKKRYQLLALCAILLCAPAAITAQVFIQGFVSLSDEGVDEGPAEGAVVRLLAADSTRMIDYTIADAEGKWQFKSVTEPVVVIEIGYFGYGTEFIRIEEPQNGIAPYETVLEVQRFELGAVTVTDKALGVKRSGDTLTFRLETYTTGAERNLGDVLKRLPGMEIRDGAVYYGGEKIQRMLVQGRDVINSNQQLALEGIRADQLEEIVIIENYKESSEQFQTERSDDVAMNVKLKEGALSKWSGEAGLLGGYPASAKAEVSAFNLNNKTGLSGFVRANNVGEQILTFRDMIAMMSDQGGRNFRAMRGDLINLIPNELNINDQVQANLDGIVNINIDAEPAKGMKIKGFVMGAYAQRESEVFSISNYIAENQVRTETRNRETRTPLGNTMWRLEWNVDSTTFVEVGAPFSLNTTAAEETRIGQFDGRDFQTFNDQSQWSYNLSPYAKLRKKMRAKDVWEADLRFVNSRQNGDQYFEDVFPFLGLSLQPQDSLFQILQQQTLATTSFNFTTNYKAFFGNWFLQPSVEYGFQDQSIDNTADALGAEDFTSADAVVQHQAIANLSAGYENARWEIAPFLTANYLKRDFRLSDNMQELYPGYGLRLVRKFNRAHALTFDASYGLQYADFQNIWKVNTINSATEIATGGYSPDLATEGYSVSLNYRNFIPARRTFIFCNLSYDYNVNVISNFTESSGAYILSGFSPTPSSERINGTFFTGFEIGEAVPIRLEPRINLSWSDGFSTNGDLNFPTSLFFQSYSFSVESRWEFPLNVEVGIQYNNNQVERDNVPGLGFESWQPSLELEYKIGSLRLESNFAFDRAGTQDLSNDLYLLDFNAFYDFEKVPLTLKLQGKNLLNLTPEERVRNTPEFNILEVRRYAIFPGFILAGVSWRF
jgi:hypothetical protein